MILKNDEMRDGTRGIIVSMIVAGLMMMALERGVVPAGPVMGWVALFLASDESGCLDGAIVVADGGITINGDLSNEPDDLTCRCGCRPGGEADPAGQNHLGSDAAAAAPLDVSGQRYCRGVRPVAARNSEEKYCGDEKPQRRVIS